MTRFMKAILVNNLNEISELVEKLKSNKGFSSGNFVENTEKYFKSDENYINILEFIASQFTEYHNEFEACICRVNYDSSCYPNNLNVIYEDEELFELEEEGEELISDIIYELFEVIENRYNNSIKGEVA